MTFTFSLLLLVTSSDAVDAPRSRAATSRRLKAGLRYARSRPDIVGTYVDRPARDDSGLPGRDAALRGRALPRDLRALAALLRTAGRGVGGDVDLAVDGTGSTATVARSSLRRRCGGSASPSSATPRRSGWCCSGSSIAGGADAISGDLSLDDVERVDPARDAWTHGGHRDDLVLARARPPVSSARASWRRGRRCASRSPSAGSRARDRSAWSPRRCRRSGASTRAPTATSRRCASFARTRTIRRSGRPSPASTLLA